MSVEFWNSLVTARPFSPSATHLTRETSIPICLFVLCKGVGSTISRAGAWPMAAPGWHCCDLPLSSLLSAGITLTKELWSCGSVMLLTSAFGGRGGWQCLQKWAWTFRTFFSLEESWVSHERRIRFFKIWPVSAQKSPFTAVRAFSVCWHLFLYGFLQTLFLSPVYSDVQSAFQLCKKDFP